LQNQAYYALKLVEGLWNITRLHTATGGGCTRRRPIANSLEAMMFVVFGLADIPATGQVAALHAPFHNQAKEY